MVISLVLRTKIAQSGAASNKFAAAGESIAKPGFISAGSKRSAGNKKRNKKKPCPGGSLLHRPHGFRSADRNDIRKADYIHLVSIILGLELPPTAS